MLQILLRLTAWGSWPLLLGRSVAFSGICASFVLSMEPLALMLSTFFHCAGWVRSMGCGKSEKPVGSHGRVPFGKTSTRSLLCSCCPSSSTKILFYFIFTKVNSPTHNFPFSSWIFVFLLTYISFHPSVWQQPGFMSHVRSCMKQHPLEGYIRESAQLGLR